MTVKELIEKTGFSVINVAEGADETEITKAYCCAGGRRMGNCYE